MHEQEFYLSQGLDRRLTQQASHLWNISPSSIKQIIPVSSGAWLYWRELWLCEPDELQAPVEHMARHGFAPVFSFGQAEDNVIAALIATPAEPFPVWVAPADFIGYNGLELMKAAAAYRSNLPSKDFHEVCLRSVAVTATHPGKCSPTAVISLSSEFERSLDAHSIDWSLHANLKDQGFDFFN